MLFKLEARLKLTMSLEDYKAIHVAVRTYLASATFHIGPL